MLSGNRDQIDQQRQIIAPKNYYIGKIIKYNTNTNRADVQLYGSINTMLSDVPVNRSITSTLLTVGARCKVDVLEDNNIESYVIAYVF